jgi:hypothetical protein
MNTVTLAPAVVELRPLRLQVEENIRVLEAAEQTAEVVNAIENLYVCLDAIDRVCGPNVIAPLTPR